MELYERKHTTAAGLEQMTRLFESLNGKLADDLLNFNGGKAFFCRIMDDNGRSPGDLYYSEWVLNEGVVVYRSGAFKIKAYDTDNDELALLVNPAEFARFEKMNFGAMIESLTDVCETYNHRAAEKDADIERFLAIVKEYCGD